jgi:peptide/nickel transport system permease protein
MNFQSLSKSARGAYSNLLRSRSAKVGFAIIVAIFLGVLLGPFLIPYNPTVITGAPNSPPTLQHPFGTDFLGHDLLSQVVYGAYPSLLVGIVAAVGGVVVGFFFGSLAGYYEKVGLFFAGATDIIMSLPSLVVLILLGILFVVTNAFLIGALVLVLWAPIARAVRAQVASIKRMPFVDSARVSGLSDWQILWTIIVPKVVSVVIAYFVFSVSVAIILVTALEFLGIGNPEIVSWGSIIFFAQQYGFYNGDWWWVLAPGLAIAFVATGFALIGFSFEELSNPRLRV